MTRNTKNIPPDTSVVALDRPEELKYWINTFGISEKVLRDVIKKVGNNPKEITVHLCQARIQNEKSDSMEHG